MLKGYRVLRSALRRQGREILVILGTGVFGIALSAGAALIAHRWAQEEVLNKLDLRAVEAVSALHDEFSEDLASLQDLAVTRETFGDLSRQEFRQLTSRILRRDSCIMALEWIPRVAAGERASHEERARRSGLAGYQIREKDPFGDWRPVGERKEYFPVFYVEPLAENMEALGFDLASDPVRGSALEAAKSSGEPRTTGRIRLVQDTSESSGFLIFQPVYRVIENTGLAEPSPAVPSLMGFMLGVYRVQDLVQTAFGDGFPEEFDVAILDGDTKAEQELLFSSLPGSADWSPPSIMGSHSFPLTMNIELPGRHWQVRLWPRAAFGPGRCCGVGWGVLLVGLVMTGSLSWYLERLRRVQRNLRKSIADLRATKSELFEEKERAQVTLRSIADGVITTDPEGHIQFMNPVAERLTGSSLSEVQGRDLDDVVNIIDEESREMVGGMVRRCLDAGDQICFSPHSVLVSRDGKEFAVRESATPIRNEKGEIKGVALVIHDASENRRMLREIAHRASHDVLTGLVNRRGFQDCLQKLLEEARNTESQHALCYLDLDHFKIVNDTAGHRAGDELLKQLAGLLQGEVRQGDTLARLGGDEFGILLKDCPLGAAEDRAHSLVEALRKYRFSWEGRRFEVGASVGLVPITGQPEQLSELLSRADVACYSAKEQGRNRVCVYSAESGDLDLRREAISRVADLSTALEDGRFCLFAQPIFSLRGPSPEVSFYEVLLRLDDGRGGLISPGNFIPAAESFGLMGAIDRWVVKASLDFLSGLFTSGSNIRFSINLSGNSLAEESLLDYVYECMRTSRVPPEHLCFEVTETAAISNLHHATRFMTELRKEGCKFALDDFGSGLASFSYLKELPVDYLKIDGGLVRNMTSDPATRAMVAAIHNLGKALGLGTIAEHARSDEIVAVLRELGVEYAQGNALGKPQPLMRLVA